MVIVACLNGSFNKPQDYVESLIVSSCKLHYIL